MRMAVESTPPADSVVTTLGLGGEGVAPGAFLLFAGEGSGGEGGSMTTGGGRGSMYCGLVALEFSHTPC